MRQESEMEHEIRQAMAGKVDIVDREDEEAEETTEELEEVNEEALEPVEEVKEPEIEPPPVSLSSPMKEKWATLPEDVRAEIKKREDDMHKAMTRHDGDLAVGRKIKEIAAPYEAIIRAEGGTVEGAFKDYMNTAYVLRTGSPQQKAQVIMQAMQQFNVDITPYLEGQQNNLTALQQEIEYLRRNQVDPNAIKAQLQEQMESDRIQAQIEAFAANPDNKHFGEVWHIMEALLKRGQAQGLQDAYEAAIWSVPSIRAELEANAEKAKAEKRKAEMAQKKKAAASVAGSPDGTSPSKNAPQKSLEDEILDNYRASQGKI